MLSVTQRIPTFGVTVIADCAPDLPVTSTGPRVTPISRICFMLSGSRVRVLDPFSQLVEGQFTFTGKPASYALAGDARTSHLHIP